MPLRLKPWSTVPAGPFSFSVRAVQGDIVDEARPGRGQLVRGFGLPGLEVVEVGLSGAAAGDEEKVVAPVHLHADGGPAGGCGKEFPCRPVADIASVDVPVEPVAGEERGPLTG